MKTYKEMADDALDRISQYEKEKQNKRKRITKIAVPAVSCCLVIVAFMGMWQNSTLKYRTKYQDEQIYTPEEILSDKEDMKGSESSLMDFCIFWWKNKITMYGDLYWAINDNPGGSFTVSAEYRPRVEKVTGFTYEGKTLYQLAVEADNERMMLEKMAELLKYGDELKYGTALYGTGTPDGIKWDRALYEEKVAYFENLLDKYIIDGRFLADKLMKDIDEYNETSAAQTYKLAYNVYLETVLPKSEKILSEYNIKCERTPYSKDSLNMVVTAEELENLPLEHIEFWVFSLTNSNLKDSQTINDAGELPVAN